MSLTLLHWHLTKRTPYPKKLGTYLLYLSDGDYTTSVYLPGGHWITTRTVVAWARLK